MTEFISRKYGNEGFEVIIKTDSKEHYKVAEDFARWLIDHTKPMTNADYIRSMTDEELAVLIMCPHEIDPDHCCEPNEYCTACCLEWLKQPYKENIDGSD